MDNLKKIPEKDVKYGVKEGKSYGDFMTLLISKE